MLLTQKYSPKLGDDYIANSGKVMERHDGDQHTL